MSERLFCASKFSDFSLIKNTPWNLLNALQSGIENASSSERVLKIMAYFCVGAFDFFFLFLQ